MSQSIDEVLLGTPARAGGGGSSGGEEEGEGDKFVRQLFESLLLGTRASNAIPDGEGHEDYAYNATFPEFRARAEGCGKQVLEVIQIFLNHVQQEGELGLPEVGDAGDPEVFQGIADVVETLLEDVDSYLDEASGKGANQQVALMRHQLRTVASAARSGPAKYASMVANVVDIPKPQEAFAEEIENERDAPFVPRIRDKPNAITPLDLSPISTTATSMGMEIDGRDESILGTGGFDFHYPHPYEVEIRAFHYMPAQVQAPDSSSLVKPEPLDGDEASAAVFVDTVEALDAMVVDIAGGEGAAEGAADSSDDEQVSRGRGKDGRDSCREIAIDLEHHSFRSFQGVVCLMQLSTRERDYIVDPLKLRAEMRRLLPVFTDPGIVKVLHGSDSDILWLQRDLGLYVVNMFDTGQAARQLGLPSFGLAHLLEHFCDFVPDKKHQLSDWRMRPLPPDMMRYAQLDTHYLLYVYDRLRADLERNGGDVAIKAVLDASREICLRRYEKPIFRERGWAAVLSRQGQGVLEEFGEASRRVLSALWDWRDSVARSEDESPGYVMSVYVMIRVARKCPTNRDELEGCGNPLPRLVQQRAEEVLAIVEDTKNKEDEAHLTPHHPRTPADAGTRPARALSGAGGSSGGDGGGSGGGSSRAAGSAVGASSSRMFNPVSSAEPYFRPFNVTPSSASQFVLAEGSRGSPSPLLVHQSPVLNTEELYRAAGWMTPLPKERRDTEDTGGNMSDEEAPEKEAKSSHGGRGMVALSTQNNQHDTSKRMAHSMVLGGSGIASGANKAATAAVPAAAEAEAAADAGARTAERIRDEIAREPVLSLANLSAFADEPGAPGKSEAFNDSDGGSGNSSAEAGGQLGDDDSPDEPGIPRSIAEIYEISNRNRRRNKEKKKLRETGAESSSPSRSQQQQQQQARGQARGADTASGCASDQDNVAPVDGPAVNYFAGRKRQKGDGAGQQGLGLLMDRRRGPQDGRGTDDTMDFMEDLGWLSHEQRQAMMQHDSPGGGPSAAADDGSSTALFDRTLSGGATGQAGSAGEGHVEQVDGYAKGGPSGSRARGGGRAGPSVGTDRAGNSRGPGTPGRMGGGGRGKGGTPKRDRDAGRGGGMAGGRGAMGGVHPAAFRGYDFSQAPLSMGAYQGPGQRDGGGGGGANGGGVFNPFLAQGNAGAAAGAQGRGSVVVHGGPSQGGYGGGRQQQQSQAQQHWRARPDVEKSKSMTYGMASMQGVGQGRGGGSNGSRRGR